MIYATGSLNKTVLFVEISYVDSSSDLITTYAFADFLFMGSRSCGNLTYNGTKNYFLCF